jgi:hypothetical protein
MYIRKACASGSNFFRLLFSAFAAFQGQADPCDFFTPATAAPVDLTGALSDNAPMKGKGKKLEDKKWLDDQEKLERLAVLVVREIDRIVFDLEFRRELLFSIWSKDRVRVPLLHALDSRFYEIKAELLLLFPPAIYQQLDDFYRSLDEFVFYISYTEDMPQNLMQKLDAYLEDLRLMAPQLIEQLRELAPNTPIELSAFEPPMPDLSKLASD